MDVKTGMVEVHLFRLVKEEPVFLLLKRSELEIYPGIWQMVTGTIEEGEKAYETALREIKEETKLKVQKLWSVPRVNSFYSPSTDSIILIPVFAALVEKNEVQLSEEHSEFQWCSTDKAIKLLAWEGQKKSVESIVKYFTQSKEYFDLVEIDF